MNSKSTSRTVDENTPITQEDIDTGRLIPRQRDANGRLIPEKKRVTLYLDTQVIDHFKRLAGERGYQTLINETLKSTINQRDMESLLRKVIREELK